MAELVAGLEARGYLERRPDPLDRRACLVRFTPRGSGLMRLALAELAEIEAEFLRRMGPCPERDPRTALDEAIQRSSKPWCVRSRE